MKYIFTLIIFVLVLLPLTGLEGPDETEIKLPPVLLEVEDVSREEVIAIFPDSPDIVLPDFDMILPEPDDLEPTVFSQLLPLPDHLDPVTTRESSFFSEGLIGVGMQNSVEGDISLYKLGTDPRFSIHFSHFGMDGYGTKRPGTGFSHRLDTLDGTMQFKVDAVDVDLALGYREEEKGLQGQADNFSSIVYRSYSGQSLFSFRGFQDRGITLAGGMDFNHTFKVLSGQEDNPSKLSEETHLLPFLKALLERPHFYVALDSFYRYRSRGGHNQHIYNLHGLEAYLTGEIEFSAFEIALGTGVVWQPDENNIFWPFHLTLSGAYQDLIQYRLEGGYKYTPLVYSQLWENHPLLDALVDYTNEVANRMTDQYGWFVEGEVQVNVHENIELLGGWEFLILQNIISPNINTVDETGLFLFDQDERALFNLTAGLLWSPLDVLQAGVTWKGQLLDKNPLAPGHQLSFNVTLENQDYGYGGLLRADLEFDTKKPLPERKLPKMGLEMFYHLSEGVTILLEGTDILSPFLYGADNNKGGSPGWGEYIEPGASVMLKTKISL